MLSTDDRRLVGSVARTVGVPRLDVPPDARSFVLHAPLELMARAALLPMVAASAGDPARQHLADLRSRYAAVGSPRPSPPTIEFTSPAAALAAIDDPHRSDAAAVWLAARCGPDRLTTLLAARSLRSLDAAGHVNIYLALLAGAPPDLAALTLRHPIHALTTGTGLAITAQPARGAPPIADVLAELDPTGPPPSDYIAPVVQHAEAHGVLASLNGMAEHPFELLRFGAVAMLQGNPAQAPYGWTHMLTLAQAALMLGHRESTFVAAAYLAAHWSGHGDGRIQLDYRPAPVDQPLAEALHTGPLTAAAVAYHTQKPGVGDAAAILASAASAHHDAHRAKYTLACLHAARQDPAGQALYLAAASYLNAWWETEADQ